LNAKTSTDYRNVTVQDLTQQLFAPGNMMVDADPRAGRYFSAAAMYRGRNISMSAVEAELCRTQNK